MSKKQRLEAPRADPKGPLPTLFAVLYGCFLGLSLLKFGNPPIMEKWVIPPTNAYEFVLGSPWPITWAYIVLALLAALGLGLAKSPARPHYWLLLLPIAWLAWQCVASFCSVSPALSRPTLPHFFACAACFYLGVFSLAPVKRMAFFWPGIVCGLLVVIAVGWEQHFGGLEQTRQYFFLYIYPRMKDPPPEYLKKLSSTRIFSTLFYPNALAGALLLLMPPSLEFIWQLRHRFTIGARILLVSVIGFGGLACLFWSGSKGGWLLMLILGLFWLLRLPFNPALKRYLVLVVLVLGLAGFFLKYFGFFQRGATSVSARFDYWEAALRTTLTHPLCGTGPGTFAIAYQKVKRPESEMTRLVHNDYLEQASDSGLPGFLLYVAFIVTALIAAYPRANEVPHGFWPLTSSMAIPTQAQSGHDPGSRPHSSDPTLPTSIRFALWLGVLGWALQSLVEFSLYIPGLAWPAFAFLGLLVWQRSHSRSKP